MKDFINKLLDSINTLPAIHKFVSIMFICLIAGGVIVTKFYFDYRTEVVRITGKEVAQPKSNNFVDEKSGRGIGIIQVDEPKQIAKSVNEP